VLVLIYTPNPRIAADSVWDLLGSRSAEHRRPDQNNRIGVAMRQLGWKRANKAGSIAIGSQHVSGYVIGEKPWPLVRVEMDDNGRAFVEVVGGKQDPAPFEPPF
jgi:hypothetical protein